LDNTTDQIKVILFHIGILSFPDEKYLFVTNDTSRKILQRALLHNVVSETKFEIVNSLLNEGNIQPILEFMNNQGIYKSDKSETFTQQNELTPQAVFVSLLNMKENFTKLEKPVYKEEDGKILYWIDAFSIQGKVINITEWKNVQIDYLDIPGETTKGRPSDTERLNKVNRLRNMNKEDVWKLKVCSWSKVNPDQSMEAIVQLAYDEQARKYAEEIQKRYPESTIYVHVALSVGTTHILHNSWLIQ